MSDKLKNPSPTVLAHEPLARPDTNRFRIVARILKRQAAKAAQRTLRAIGLVDGQTNYQERKKKRVGRKPFRQAQDQNVNRYRGKFLALAPLDDVGGKISIPDNFEPHRGNDTIGNWQVDFLKRQGLQPHHVILDIGCGDLRSAIPLIRYLQTGCYTGVDQAEIAIRQGLLSATPDDLAKQPSFFVGGDFGFESIGRTFDFAWAHSVLTHVDLSVAAKCLESAYLALNPGGVLLVSYFPAPVQRPWSSTMIYRARSEFTGIDEKLTYGYRNPYHHPTELLKLIASSIGYEPSVVDEQSPKRQSILKLIKHTKH